MGYRPKQGSIFYSPSLAMTYSYSDFQKKHNGMSPFELGFKQGMDDARLHEVYRDREEDQL